MIVLFLGGIGLSFCFFNLSCMKFLPFLFVFLLIFFISFRGGGGFGFFFFFFFFFSVSVRLGVVFLWWLICFLFFLCFLNLTCKQTYDTWRLGHVVPDDVVIADIGDHALDIFLHGPESTHKNGIGKTFTHTSIPIHLSKLRAKSTTYWTWFFPLLVLFLSNVVGVDGQEAWQMLLRTAPRRRPSRPGQYRQKTFVDVLNTYSNISRQRWPF